VNYVGNKTTHMQAGISFAALNANPGNVITQARALPGFANENIDAPELFSKYNALQVQLKRNAKRLTLEANYTWSHEIDDLVNVFSGFSNPFNAQADVGSGDWDVRQNFTASALYNLPDLKNQNTIVREVFGGWQTSTILQVRSGLPVNVSLESGFFGIPMRPQATGAPIRVSGSNYPNSPFNVDAFQIDPNFDGSWGVADDAVGRNLLRGPGFAQVDWSLMKNFPIRERFVLQFRADLFNLFNHPNFAGPDGGICTAVTPFVPAMGATPAVPATCTQNPNFGRIGETIASANGSQIGTGTARQAQFSLRLTF
jgi:hypothetical protein